MFSYAVIVVIKTTKIKKKIRQTYYVFTLFDDLKTLTYDKNVLFVC